MNMDVFDEDIGDIARGYRRAGERWVCAECGETYEDGVVYTLGDGQYEAFRAVREHVRIAHGPVFLSILATQREFMGLTERQAEILALMFDGCNDREIAERLAMPGSTSIRNLRFLMKEREKQAKVFLALMEAFRTGQKTQKSHDGATVLPPHAGATLSDERFAITDAERAAVLKAYFTADGVLKEFPVREKRKVIVLMEIAKRFEKGRVYTEKEVNEVIAWRDFATVRRYLVEYGFMDRSPNCSRYWVKEDKPRESGKLSE